MKHATISQTGSPGLTFLIAIWVLGIFAAAQFVAVIWKVVPATIVRAAVAQESAQASEGPYRPEPVPVTQQPVAAPLAPERDPAEMQRAMALVSEADRASRVGDWEKALVSLIGAMEIMEDEPVLEVQYAFVLERLGREEEALEILTALTDRDDLEPPIRAEAARLKSNVEQTLFNLEQSGIVREPPAGEMETRFLEDSSALPPGPVLEDMGLQPGATLGIVEAREIDSNDGIKTLRIAIKSRPNMELDGSDVKVIVRFFEQGPEGEILLTDAQVNSQWISHPIDWKDNEPEILDVVYPVPKEGESENAYHGYVVGIYFRDELQDTRAVPGGLDQTFPPELFLESAIP